MRIPRQSPSVWALGLRPTTIEGHGPRRRRARPTPLAIRVLNHAHARFREVLPLAGRMVQKSDNVLECATALRRLDIDTIDDVQATTPKSVKKALTSVKGIGIGDRAHVPDVLRQ